MTPGLAGGRDDIGFAQAVLVDARERLALPADAPLVLAGFSLGASMVWTLACAGQPDAAGYIAFSGAFWEPAPERCARTTAPMVHFHGLDDVTVPVMGREVRSGRRQAPIAKAFAAIAAVRACRQPPVWEAISSATLPGLECAGLAECRGPGAMLYCAHGEGHSLRLEWLSFALARVGAAAGDRPDGK